MCVCERERETWVRGRRGRKGSKGGREYVCEKEREKLG